MLLVCGDGDPGAVAPGFWLSAFQADVVVRRSLLLRPDDVFWQADYSEVLRRPLVSGSLGSSVWTLILMYGPTQETRPAISQPPNIKTLYHRVEKDSKNFGRVFVHFRFER